MVDQVNLPLPVIDISPFINSVPENPSTHPVTIALRDALYDYGFFYVKNHSLPRSLTDQVLECARRFFLDSSDDQKAILKRRDVGDRLGDGARGYQRIGENVSAGHQDWHEALDWYAPIVPGEGIDDEEFTNVMDSNEGSRRRPPFTLLNGINLWPSHPAEFRDVFEEYVAECRNLGEIILRAIGYALDLDDPDFLVKAVQDSFWVMRAINYPPLDNELAKTGGVSCGEHTDYGCLTLLLDDGTPDALQVWLADKNNQSGDWINVQPVRGSLVVNIGDMIEKWSGGMVKSTKHRVVHTGKSYRISVPFFLEPSRNTVVTCLHEFKQRRMGKSRDRALEPEVTECVKYGDHLAEKVGGNFYGKNGQIQI